ncbi:MAG: hypothetical protein BWY89_01402 [Bacteroidetes bacterium ADurb.BinA012]|nr:MAG: hypothetical protein BWY89_01402 [Bacteroidetes bacterium ADurb.BinA012]
MYPTLFVTIYAASRLFTGILSRVIVKSSSSFSPFLKISTSTFVPFGPLSLFCTPVVEIPMPATFSPAMNIILSPAIMPTFSDGPPGMGEIIIIVSFSRLN